MLCNSIAASVRTILLMMIEKYFLKVSYLSVYH